MNKGLQLWDEGSTSLKEIIIIIFYIYIYFLRSSLFKNEFLKFLISDKTILIWV